jgi:hypothetical protein
MIIFAADNSDPLRARRLSRIRSLSRVMAILCLVTALLLVAAIAYYWLATPAGALLAAAGVNGKTPPDIGWTIRFGGFVISMIPLAALTYGLMQARRCFTEFAGGRIFSMRTVGGLRMFSIAIALSALFKPLASAALSVLLSSTAVSGGRTLALTVGSDTLLTLLFAGMVAVIAWVMTDAVALADENAQFI